MMKTSCDPKQQLQLQMFSECIYVLLVAVFAALTSAQSTRPIYKCHTDICNRYGQDQFCSAREEKCRNCLEVIDSCFEAKLPNNCTRTCVDYHVEKELEKAKESTCDGFGPIENGRSNGSLLQLYNQGDVISVTCDVGFRLSSTQTIECKSYGQWSHDLPTCEEITCPVLPHVSNGKHNGSLTIPHKPGDILTVQCNHGYQRIGPETTRCDSNGAWHSQLSFCQKFPDFPPIKDGNWQRQISATGQESDIIHVTCDSGYTLEGPATFRWSLKGTWKSSDGHIPFCSKDEGINFWMVACLITGTIIILGIYYYCYTQHTNHKTSKEPRTHTNGMIKTTKEIGIKEETKVLIENEEMKFGKPNSEHEIHNRDVSLHDQKLQKEGTTAQNSSKCQFPELQPTGYEHGAFLSNQTEEFENSPNVDQPVMPYTSYPVSTRVLQEQNVSKDDATAQAEDVQSNVPSELPRERPESGNQVNFNITIHNNSSADNSSSVTVNNEANGMPAKSATNSFPSTSDTSDLEMKDLKEEEKEEVLKSPIEESATFQPSHPETLSDTEDKAAVATDTYQEPPRRGDITNEDSDVPFRPVNELAVQQNTNNEQDNGRKVAMPNGNLNTDDLGNHL